MLTESLIKTSNIHPSLNSSHINTMGFLNEVMRRFPTAISFAPGAPNEIFYQNVNLMSFLERFQDYLVEVKGESPLGSMARILEYGPSAGIINDLVCDGLKNCGLANANSDHVVITAGAQEGIVLALRAIFKDGDDTLAVTTPCYAGIIGAAQFLGIDIVEVPEGSDGPSISALEGHIDSLASLGKRVRALYVAPDFANPSGCFMTSKARARLLSRARDKDIILIEDTAYSFTVSQEERLMSLFDMDEGSITIQVGTFSKIAFPSMRVGYLVTKLKVAGESRDANLSRLISSSKSMLTVNTCGISQAILGGMLLNWQSMAMLAEEKAILYRQNIDLLVDRMEFYLSALRARGHAICWSSPKGGFFVTVDLPIDVDDDLLNLSANKFGVLWTPMRYFHLSNAGDRQLRLSCSFLSSLEIDRGVERIAKMLEYVLEGVTRDPY